jgi:hypothetical protein
VPRSKPAETRTPDDAPMSAEAAKAAIQDLLASLAAKRM